MKRPLLVLVVWVALCGFKGSKEELNQAFGYGYAATQIAGKDVQTIAITAAQKNLWSFVSNTPIAFELTRLKGATVVNATMRGSLVDDAGVIVQEIPGGILARANRERTPEELEIVKQLDLRRGKITTSWPAERIPWQDALEKLIENGTKPCSSCRVDGLLILVNSRVDQRGKELTVELIGHVIQKSKQRLTKKDQIVAYRGAAQKAARDKRWPDAITSLKKATALSPKDATLYAELGQVAWRAGVLEAAKTAMARLTKLEPDEPKWRRMYEMLRANKSWNDAQAQLLRDRLATMTKQAAPDWLNKGAWISKEGGKTVWRGVGMFKLPKRYTELNHDKLTLSISVAHNRARAEVGKLDNVTVKRSADGRSTRVTSKATLTGVKIAAEYLAADGRTFYALAEMDKTP